MYPAEWPAQLVRYAIRLPIFPREIRNVGQYEKIVGQAYGEIGPKSNHNAIIQDTQLAPGNSRMVEYVATFTLLKPIDMAKGSNVILYE